MRADRFYSGILCVLLVAATAASLTAAPLGSGFLYQAQLKLDGEPLDGTADLRFTLHDATTLGMTVDGPLTTTNKTVVSGLVNVELDFGANVFDGTALWLEVEVRSPHDPANLLPFTTLLPRQPLAAAPYALQTRGIFVDENTGNVGIGTNTPGDILEVSKNLGGMIRIGLNNPNASGDTSLSLLEGPAQRAMFWFDNAANKLTVRTTGSEPIGFQIGSLVNKMTIVSNGNIGIGTNGPSAKLQVVGDVAVTGSFGDASVVLPSDAISAAEILNEPGAASTNSNSLRTLTGAVDTILSRTITVPASGFVLALGTCQANASHITGTSTIANFAVSNAAGVVPATQDIAFVIPAAYPTGAINRPVTVQSIFPVSAGANTFYFLGDENSGSVSCNDMTLSLIYVPTAYGTVLAPLTAPGRADRFVPEVLPLGKVEIETEQLEAEAFHQQRLQRELKQMQAQVQALQTRLDQVLKEQELDQPVPQTPHGQSSISAEIQSTEDGEAAKETVAGGSR